MGGAWQSRARGRALGVLTSLGMVSSWVLAGGLASRPGHTKGTLLGR